MKRSRFAVAFLSYIICLSSVLAGWQSVGNVDSTSRSANQFTFFCGPAAVQLSVLAPDLVRVRLAKEGSFQDDFSWAVTKTDWVPIEVTVSESSRDLEINTGELRIVASKAPFRVAFFDMRRVLINCDDSRKGMGWDGEETRVWKEMPSDEQYYGFGEKSGPLNKRGQALAMWNSDKPGYTAATDPIYQTIPFFLALRDGLSYGIFFDNTYRSSFDMGKESRTFYSFGAEAGELNYYFIYGPDPKKVIGRYTDLIGRMPLPPRWAIGYQQCRYSYYPESRVREVVRNFRDRKIPCDVIYLDIHYMNGYRCFTWDRDRFPDPKAMVGDLAREGFKVVVIIDPGIKNEEGYGVFDSGVLGDHFVRRPDGTRFVGRVWPGDCVFPDFTRAATRVWWGDLYRGLVEDGIRGFWNDMNEPAVFDGPGYTFPLDVQHDGEGHPGDHLQYHNVFGMQMARGTYEGAGRLRPGERPFVLTRASYAGGQRYAAAWTGDNTSRWEDLAMSIPMVLNFGISGQPFAGPDIGGFIGSPSGELYTRWLQIGSLNPLSRTHTEFGSRDQEPWSFGPEFEAINRASIEWRYRLLPYLYTTFYEASVAGTPIMRPLFLEFPDDRETYWIEDEFFLGDDLLVAPATEEGEEERNVYLPHGRWYDFWSGERLMGGKWLKVRTPIERIPIFVRSGSIIPMQQVVQYTDQEAIDPLTLSIYPDTSSSAMLYEDDGLTFDYKKGIYSIARYNYSQVGGVARLKISERQGRFVPPKRSLVLKFNGFHSEPPRVLRSGSPLPNASTPEGFATSSQGWMYDPTAKVILVKLEDEGKDETIEFKMK